MTAVAIAYDLGFEGSGEAFRKEVFDAIYNSDPVPDTDENPDVDGAQMI